MPVTVVVVQTPKPGRLQDGLDALASVAHDVHAERGNEFYAAHTDGEHIVNVERWATREDLEAHAAGPAVQRLYELTRDAMLDAGQIFVLDAVPMGDLTKGVLT
ncbi:putative quinol monooxygenase [Arthrobacter sp. KN11-1C]|uniref:putative quinol monooxygenase n=1 Tax=Arthrobacter sp. KN11-1C TaxID=3445774 RepID=UPI003FA12A1F